MDGILGKFNAPTPFDLDGLTYESRISLGSDINSIALNKEATKIFTLKCCTDEPIVTTLELPAAHDLSSSTQIHQVNLNTLGIEDNTGADQPKDIEFSEYFQFPFFSPTHIIGVDD